MGGAQVARLRLDHGDDPKDLLAARGWDVVRARDVIRHPVERHLLTLSFVVERSAGRPTARGDVPPVELSDDGASDDNIPDDSFPDDSFPDDVARDGVARDGGARDDDVPDDDVPDDAVPGVEGALRHQRVAAYAVVTSWRGVLMTQFSEQTGAAGQWGLPGGGLEADETPERAVLREVWEESGQVIQVSELAMIGTSRWVGLAPNGRLEDYHVVRVIYRAFCREPTEPVVHDVGGTTASAAWLPSADLDLLALTSGWRSILREVTG